MNKDIHGLNFFDHTFLYLVYADCSTFFLNDKESVKEVINYFDAFSIQFGLKPNKSKCNIAWIGILRGVSMEHCKMKCIDLRKNFSRNLRYSFFF